MNIFRGLLNWGRVLLHAGNHKDLAPRVPRKYYDATLGWSVWLPPDWKSSRDIESVSFYSPDGLAGVNVSAWSVLGREDAAEQLFGRLAVLRSRPGSGAWRERGEVGLAGSRARVYANQTGDLDVQWYLFSSNNIAFVVCSCSAREATARRLSTFMEILETFSVPDRELPWALPYRGAYYFLVDDLEVPGNLSEAGEEWAGFPVYRRRAGFGKGLRLFLPRGTSGLFQAYEELAYSQERTRLEEVARTLHLTSYLTPAGQVDVQLTIELLKRAAVEYFEKTFGLRLDGTGGSLEELERILRLKEWTGQLRAGNNFFWTVGMVGSYLGELVRDTVRCYWFPRKPYWASSLVARENGAIEPFKIATKALSEPEGLWLEHAYGQALRGVWPHSARRQTAA